MTQTVRVAANLAALKGVVHSSTPQQHKFLEPIQTRVESFGVYKSDISYCIAMGNKNLSWCATLEMCVSQAAIDCNGYNCNYSIAIGSAGAFQASFAKPSFQALTLSQAKMQQH